MAGIGKWGSVAALAIACLASGMQGEAVDFEVEQLPKSRVVVLTDMLNEPDDSQTMVRLLMYSNEVDIEGLIAVSSCHQYAGKNDVDDVRNDVHPQAIIERVQAFGMIRENLLQHDNGWPLTADLLEKVAAGQSGYGMSDVGDGRSTTGSDLIVRALLKVDDRPLFVCINAGANTLAQALWDLKQRADADTLESCLKKLRVYDDAGQDNAGAWIAHTYPQVRYLRSQSQVFHFMNGQGPVTWDERLEPGEGQHFWVMQNVMIGHGPLGSLYPIRKQWQKPTKWHTLEGGGTSTWIGHVNHGLWHPEKPHWGGWGGRFQTEPTLNPEATQLKWADLQHTEPPFRPYWMIVEAEDTWVDPETGQYYSGVGVPVFRWRRAYQNDFEARMDWCVEDFEHANHAPVAAVEGDLSDGFITVKASAGHALELDASASTDRDGDALTFRWFVYPESGNLCTDAVNLKTSGARCLVTLSQDVGAGELHLILEVKDDGVPSLVDYRRVRICVRNPTQP